MIKVIKKINKQEFKDFLYHIDLNDENLYKELNTSQIGIFQMTGNTASGLIKRVNPKTFEEANVINAASRPGTINFIEDYIKNESGNIRKYPEIIHSLIEESRGVIFFQEQIMTIFNKIGGFTLEDTNYTRSLMKKLGKKDKKQEDINAWNECVKRFSINAEKKGLTEEEVKKITDDLLGLAEYSFNRSHSVSYTYVGMQTLYLSHYFKPYFYSAILATKTDEALAEYVSQIRAQGINILPPDINKSKEHFYPIDDKNILYGLTDIKFTGDNPTKKIIEMRPYNSLFYFIFRTRSREITSRVINALISVGCFDWYDKNRKKLLAIVEEFWERKKAIKIEEKLKALWDEIEKKYNSIPFPSFDNNDIVNLEKEFFGYRAFTNPFDDKMIKAIYRMYEDDLIYLSFDNVEERVSKKIPCIIEDVRVLKDKNSNEMAFVSISDIHGNNTSIPVFASYWQYIRDYFKKGSMLFINVYNDSNGKMLFGYPRKITEEIIIRRMIKVIK